MFNVALFTNPTQSGWKVLYNRIKPVHSISVIYPKGKWQQRRNGTWNFIVPIGK